MNRQERRAARPRIPAGPKHTEKRPTSGHYAGKRWVPKVRGLWSPAVAEVVRQWHRAQMADGPRPNARRKRWARPRAKLGDMLATEPRVITLSERDFDAVLEAIDNPRLPSPALVEAAREYREHFLGGETPLGSED